MIMETFIIWSVISIIALIIFMLIRDLYLTLERGEIKCPIIILRILFSLRRCGGCGDWIYPWEEAVGFSPPARCNAHDSDICKIKVYKKWNKEPYKSIVDRYRYMCENRDKMTPQDWKEYQASRF